MVIAPTGSNNRLTTETRTKNSVASIAKYQYDKNGNQLSRTEAGASETNEYDVFNRMTKAVKGGVTSTYAYKADGLRFSKTVNGVKTTHIWDGSNIALELNGSNTVTNSYIWGMNLIKSANNGYYVYNAHGDVTKLTNASGGVTKSYDYDAFGVEVNQVAGDANPFRYCGEYFDAESGNVYLRARYYSPVTGRFLAEDPIRDGLNWYTYCGNNPILFIDPSGCINIGTLTVNKNASITVTGGEINTLVVNNGGTATVNNGKVGTLVYDKASTVTVNLGVSIYNQLKSLTNNDENNLCWAASASMVISYQLGDKKDRTLEIALNVAKQLKEADYNVPRSWVSTHALGYKGVNVILTQTKETLTM